ncbi:MAG: DUF4097 family beta strand repeat protein [Candidatus Aminicenantes bacterium]|nr:DUF4097 family beta strand repeat protein [Candidatus Aminicenantes bacterium]
MQIMTHRLRALNIFVMLLAFLLIGSAGASIDDTITKSFAVEPGGTLNIETARGSIEVRAVAGSSVDIEVIRKVRTSDTDKAKKIFDDFRIDFNQSGNDVFVKAEKKYRESIWDKIWNRLNVKYIVTVPRKYNVKLKTSGGSIAVDGLTGEVDVKTSGGSLKLNSIIGPVIGRTSGGSIRIGEVQGDVDVHTSGGSIGIECVTGTVDADTSGGGITVNEVRGSIQANTSGGSIKATLTRQPDADCRLTTSGGSVTVYLNGDIAVDVDAGTSGGSVHTEFPVTLTGKIDKKKLKAKINGGGPLLYLHTSGGSIYLKKR